MWRSTMVFWCSNCYVVVELLLMCAACVQQWSGLRHLSGPLSRNYYTCY